MRTKTQKDNNIPQNWWREGYFFGKRYFYPDNSKEGYLINQKESLEERTLRETNGLINLLGLKEGSKILDAPCGYGRHSIALSKKAYDVTGIDIDLEHLKKASLDSNGLNVRFLKRDLRNIGAHLYNNFDGVINMFYSFGFFQKEEDNFRVMKEFYNSLRNGGSLLLHTDVSPEMIQNKTTVKECIRTLENNHKLIILENYNSKTKRMEGSWETTDEIGKIIFPRAFYSMRIYSSEEFKYMAEKCGFKDVNVYGSFNGEKFNSESTEMIVVGKK
ncbi:MAG: class I SAM-dependent methyltransferase [Nanoarchaeota archaeon]|nr:class I SAM-dependent methyltransferase [Nanoarchaeota archaeon]